MHVRRDDIVEVISGDDAGTPNKRKVARVLRVMPRANRVIVEGVNRVYKHVRPNRQNPQGGRLSKEMPIHASKVLKFCDRCGRGVRIGFRLLDDGAKERFCKHCGGGLGLASPPKASRARKS